MQRVGESADVEGAVLHGVDHHAITININDLAPYTRQQLLSKECRKQILELHGHVVIKVRGTHVTKNRTPGPGEQPLHLIVQGSRMVDVRGAVNELRRRIAKWEELSGATSGRYSVM
ncbi:MAG: hypothetical protein MHM6MM_007957 [Cercozoa sp. M6MM]